MCVGCSLLYLVCCELFDVCCLFDIACCLLLFALCFLLVVVVRGLVFWRSGFGVRFFFGGWCLMFVVRFSCLLFLFFYWGGSCLLCLYRSLLFGVQCLLFVGC